MFDGHSGKETLRICSETVCQRLMEAGPPFKEQAIIDMLWAVDEEIGYKEERRRDGTDFTHREVRRRLYSKGHLCVVWRLLCCDGG